MPIPVELNLRIPSVKEPVKNEAGWPINSADVRLIRQVDLPALPKPGELIEVWAGPETPFHALVVRTDWHEAKAMFVVSCKYSKQSIPRPLYLALMEGSDWTIRPLVE